MDQRAGLVDPERPFGESLLQPADEASRGIGRRLALDCARAVESGGAAEITVHARTRDDRYRPPARWEWLAHIRETVKLPVVANGEVWTPQDYQKIRYISGCTDVMIGRGAIIRPDLMHRILDVTAQSVIAYLNAQIESGAQAVMIFDSWGGVLSHEAYQQFSLAYIQKIMDGLIREYEGEKIPAIVFTKGGGLWLESIAATGCDAVGLDWTVDIGAARARVGNKVALQGNLDPNVLFAPPEVVEREAKKVLDSYGHGSGHVFNLGHGISQYTPPEHVSALVKAVHDHSRQYHQGA